MPTVSPRRMTIDDVSHAMLSGGDLSWSPPGFRQCGTRRPWLGTLLDRSVLMMMLEYDRGWAQCGCLKIECLLRTLSRHMGEGCRPSPVLGLLTRTKAPAVPVLLADGPQLGSWQVAVVRVDDTPAGDASGRE